MSKQRDIYLMYPPDLTFYRVVHCTGACGAFVTRHVNTYQMHIGW